MLTRVYPATCWRKTLPCSEDQLRQADGTIIQESTIAATRDALDDWIRSIFRVAVSRVPIFFRNRSSFAVLFIIRSVSRAGIGWLGSTPPASYPGLGPDNSRANYTGQLTC